MIDYGWRCSTIVVSDWLWLHMDDYGWLTLGMVNHRRVSWHEFQNCHIMNIPNNLWPQLTMANHPWAWLTIRFVYAWLWMMMLDYCCHWLTMASHGWLWLTCIGHGWPSSSISDYNYFRWIWLTVVAFGWFYGWTCLNMFDHGWTWLTMLKHQPWLNIVKNVWLWFIMVDHGWPWLTMS